MKCPVCGATCVCRKATEQCCACHKHKVRGPRGAVWPIQLGRELAHAAAAQQRQDAEIQPELFKKELPDNG